MTSQPLSVNCLKAVCTYQWVRSMICIQRSEVWVVWVIFVLEWKQHKTRRAQEISESSDPVSIAACLRSSIRMFSWCKALLIAGATTLSSHGLFSGVVLIFRSLPHFTKYKEKKHWQKASILTIEFSIVQGAETFTDSLYFSNAILKYDKNILFKI